MMAAIAPVPTGTASCMNSPRLRTMRTASAKRKAPATTRALYSPRLWPAASAGRRPRSAHAVAAATEAVNTAGCVLAVRASSVSGPSKASRARSNPSASLASSKMALAPADVSQKALPMPVACEPWPGNRNAMLVTTSLPPHESRAPREAAPERDDEHEVPALEPAGGDRFLERDVDRGGAGVAVAVDVDEDAVHRQV